MKVLMLTYPNDKKSVDFILEDGSYSFTYLDEEGFITLRHSRGRITNETDLKEYFEELSQHSFYITDFNGDKFPKRTSITNDVIDEAILWHLVDSNLDKVQIIKKSFTNNSHNDIRVFLEMFGGFKFPVNN